MKKSIILVCFLFVNIASAQSFTGFYTSRAPVLSLDNTRLQTDVDYYSSGAPDSYIDASRKQLVNHVLLGGYTDFGYSFLIANKIYIGMSVFAQLNEGTRGRSPRFNHEFNKGALHIQEGSVTEQRSNFYTGFQLSPGILITPKNLVYLNIGTENVVMKTGLPATCYVDKDDAPNCTSPGANEKLPAETIKKRMTLLQLGLGYEYAISPMSQLFVRVNNISHAPYKIERIEEDKSFVERKEIYTVKPNYWQVTFGIKRYF